MIRPLTASALALCCLIAPLAAEDAAAARTADRAVAARLLAAYVFVHGGSGVVVSSDGLVLTNNHVIANEDRHHLELRFADGVSHHAELLGTDPVGDIAVLRIADPGPWPCVGFAPAEALRAGITVFAVGNPFGLGDVDSTPTLTRGVLSTARIVHEDYTDALQVDAPVNPGNSGGPSFDEQGRLLGINGQIRTLSGMRINSGVGLAICSTQLAAFLPLLAKAEGGYAHHTAKPAALELVQQDDGVYVKAAGELPLSAGERLVAVAGRPAVTLATAEGLFRSLPFTPGRIIAVRVRNAEGAEREVLLPAGRTTIPGKPWHGMTIGQMEGAVRVNSVDPGSPALAAGVQVGEVLVSAAGRPLARKIDFLKALVKLEIGDWLELRVRDATGGERDVRMLLRQAD
jgi:S1-C subfamily serine protease